MDTFDFPYHSFRTKYPETGLRVQFGNNYTFTTGPEAPVVREFRLTFVGMKYYLNDSGEIDLTVNLPTNMAVLEKFFQDHLLHETFIYPHPVYGNVYCKFRDPLEIPDILPGSGGVVRDFEISFQEVTE